MPPSLDVRLLVPAPPDSIHARGLNLVRLAPRTTSRSTETRAPLLPFTRPDSFASMTDPVSCDPSGIAVAPETTTDLAIEALDRIFDACWCPRRACSALSRSFRYWRERSPHGISARVEVRAWAAAAGRPRVAAALRWTPRPERGAADPGAACDAGADDAAPGGGVASADWAGGAAERPAWPAAWSRPTTAAARIREHATAKSSRGQYERSDHVASRTSSAGRRSAVITVYRALSGKPCEIGTAAIDATRTKCSHKRIILAAPTT